MRIRAKERARIFRLNKIWKMRGYGIPDYFFSFFRKNHSLNCGCAHCRGNTWLRRYNNRRLRRQEKKIIEKEINLS